MDAHIQVSSLRRFKHEYLEPLELFRYPVSVVPGPVDVEISTLVELLLETISMGVIWQEGFDRLTL